MRNAIILLLGVFIVIFADIYSVRAGTLGFDGVPVDITTSSGEDLVIVPGEGGNTQVGDGNGSNTYATSNDDLHITGILEVDGDAYFDSSLTFFDVLTAEGGITSGANIASDTDSTDDLGTSLIAWANIFADKIRTTSGTNLIILPTSAYTIIGDAASAAGNTLDNDDLFITGKLEIDEMLYADGGITANTITSSGANLALNPASSYGLTSSVTRSAATGDEAAFNLAATINKATSGNYTGLKLNVTETSAPGTADKLLDLQAGGTSYFQIYNGANSANYGALSVGSGAFDGTTSGYFTGLTSGTLLAGNAASGFLGNLIDMQVAGNSKFSVDVSGNVTAAGTITGGGSGLAPIDATYITQTANTTLTAEQALSSLDTGLMKVTTTTGVISSVTDSAGIAGVISDETGSGSLVLGTTPTFTTSLTSPLVIGGTGTTSGLNLQTTLGVGATGADMHFLVGNNGATEAMTVLNSGYVGIGTTSPSAKLEIRSSESGAITSIIQAATGQTADILQIKTPSSQLLTLNSSGNLGIGTTNPAQKLHVEGQCVTGDTLLPVIRLGDRSEEIGANYSQLPASNPQLLTSISQPSEQEELGAKSLEQNLQTPSSQLLTPNCIEYIPITDVKPGDYVLSLNEETGEIEPRRIKGLLDMGVKPVFKMTTADGRYIKTTGNHPYLVKGNITEEQRESSAQERIKTISLKEALAIENFSEEKECAEPKYVWINLLAEEDKEGSYNRPELTHDESKCPTDNFSAGPGNFNTQFFDFYRERGFGLLNLVFNSFLGNLIQDFYQSFSAAFAQFFPQDIRYSNNRHNSLLVYIKNNIHNLFCQAKNNNLAYASIPNYIENNDANWLKVIYLQEGDEIAVCNEVEGNKLEARSWKHEAGNSKLETSSLQPPASGIVWDKIVSIEYVGEEQVYDIEVEGTHNFIAGHWIVAPSEQEKLGAKSLEQNLQTPNSQLLTPNSFFGGIIAHNTYMSGNVGIGTTAPSAKLEIRSSESGAITSIIQAATGQTADILQIKTPSSQLLTLNSSGNLGIGTTAPTSPLHVDPAAQATTTAAFARTFVDNTGAITTNTGNTAVHGLMIDEPNITVGTATPTNASSLYISGAPTEATNNYALWVDDGNVQLDGNLTVGGTFTAPGIGDITSVGNVSSGAAFDGTQGTTLTFYDVGGNGILSYDGTDFDMNKPATIATSLTSPTLIGGTTTTSDLNLKTTSAVGAAGADMHFLVGDNGGTEAMTILNNGNVGIGTTAPSEKLHIDAGTNNVLARFDSTNTANSRLFLNVPANADSQISFAEGETTKWTIGSDGSDSDKFKIMPSYGAFDGSEVLTIQSNGNVGIGTTTPAVALHIVRNGNTLRLEGTDHSYIEFYPDGPSTRKAFFGFAGDTQDYITLQNEITGGNIVFNSSGTGSVGIGDATPDGKLDFDFASTAATAGAEYGANFTASDTGVVTSGTDTTYGQYISTTRTGATGGTIATYGLYSTLTADDAGAGTSTAYGIYSAVTGADTNYPAYFTGGPVMITDGTHTVNNATGSGDLFVDGSLEVDGTIYGTVSGLSAITGTTADTFTINSDGTIATSELALGATGSTGGKISTGAGNLTIDTAGGTITINDTTLDLSTQAVAITLNNSANALNFDTGTLSIDALNNYVGIGTTAPGSKLDIQGGNINTSGTVTASGGNSANWNTGYSERLQWDGGATNLVAATGRQSLGLGALATIDAVSGGTGGTITDLTITNADISATAAIVDTKLATIETAGKVSDTALSTNVSLLGQTIESSEITNATITNDDISATAGIVTSKLADSTAISDAMTKRHTQGTDTTLGTMTANIAMGSHKITGLLEPTSDQDATTKYYVDNAIAGLSWKEAVIDKDLATPPGSPAENDRYLIASTGATGDWLNKENNYTRYHNEAWVFEAPEPGDAIFIEDEKTAYTWNDTTWVAFTGASAYIWGYGLTNSGTTINIDTTETVDLSTAQSLTNKTLSTGTVLPADYYASTYVNEGQASSITSSMITDGEIANADISNTAAIAGTKISPDFGNQNIITTGSVGIGAASPSASLDIVNTATAGGLTTLELNPGAHTAMTAEKSDFSIAAHTDTITGGYAAQRFSVFNTPTISAASALTVTNADTVNIAGIPTAAGSAIISGASALRIPVAPQASANVGLVSLGSGAWDGATAGYFTGDTSGTILAANSATGYTGNLMDLQVYGASKFKVDENGNVTVAGTITGAGIGVAPANATYITQTTDTTLTNEQALSALDTGLMKVTTATGVISSITDSAGIAGVISDKTGTGSLVFGTTPTFTTSLTSPLVIGGTTTTSDLYLKTTSEVGATGADMHFLVGNNGATEAMTILNSGYVGIGTIVPQSQLNVIDEVGSSASRGIITGEHVSNASAALIQFRKSRGTQSSPLIVANADNIGAFFAQAYSGSAYTEHAGFGFIINGTVSSGTVPTDIIFSTKTTDMSTIVDGERVRITSGGNVGIGTTGPVSPLQVDPAAQATTAATFARTFIDNTGAITTNTGNTAVHGLMIDEPNITVGTATPTNASSLYISGAPTEATNNYAFWVDDGNVQLDGNLTVSGTFTAPGIGDITSVGDVSSGAAFDGTQGTTLTFNNAGGDGVLSYDGTSFNLDKPAVITTNVTSPTLIGGTTTTSDLNLKTTSAAGATGADMHFLVGNNGATEAMTVLNSGYVGIGTTAPGAELQIGGTTPEIRIGDDGAENTSLTFMGNAVDYYITLEDSSDDLLIGSVAGFPVMIFENTGGYVGIQNTGSTPKATLHVTRNLSIPTDLGDFSSYHFVIQGGTSTGQTAGLLLATTADTYGGSAMIHFDTGGGGMGDLAFYTKQSTAAEPPVEVMRLDDTGNVGIGTTAPAQKLHVEGQCVTGDTILKVKSEEEEFEDVQIKGVQPGMMVYSLNEETGGVEAHQVEALIDMGIKPVFKLITETGKVIRTTGNHPYLAAKMEGVDREEIAFRRIKEIAAKQSGIDRESLAGERNIFDGKVLWNLSSNIKDNQRKINYQNDNSNNKKNGVIHTGLPLAQDYPNKDNKSDYSGDKIESQKRHNFLAPIFESITAIIRNNTVIAMPIENVSNGALTTTPGTNMPTTNEANRIFAPSRKNSESVSKLSLSNIQQKSTIETAFCQEAWTKVIYLVPGDLIAVLNEAEGNKFEARSSKLKGCVIASSEGAKQSLSSNLQPLSSNSNIVLDKIVSIEYVGEEQVYDIEVEGTHNFVANGIIAHNTYMSGNVGIGTTGPVSPLQVDPAAQSTTTATFARTFVDNTNAITTNTGNTAVHGLMIDEPNITVGTATPTNASSLYISGAPTEATNNYALWVDDGNVQLDGDLTVSGTFTAPGIGDITSVGNVSSGAAFDGTQGTTLTFYNAGGNGILSYDGTDFDMNKPATIATSLTSPTLIGGTTTTSDLNLKTTTAVGETGADMHFLVGNNGATEAMTILNSGYVGIGTTAPSAKLDIQGGNINTSGTVTASGGNSANWNTGYSERLQWDGGATNLVAATGRQSLGLGALATIDAVSGGTGGTITDLTITNADISATAGIVDTKLATIETAGKVSDTALSTNVSLLGQTIESSEITDLTIVNADISATAGIVTSKLADSTAISDAMTKRHTQGTDTTLGTMTANIAMGSHKITGLLEPTSDQDATTKYYVDNAIAGLSWKEAVIDKDLATPPGSPAENDRYLIASTGATGDWLNKENNYTRYHNEAWIFEAPEPGDAIFIEDEKTAYTWNDTTWVAFTGASAYIWGYGLTNTGTTINIDTTETVDLSTAQSLTNKTLSTGTVLPADYYASTYVNEGQASSITSSMITDGEIANADISATAAIAGTKISPDFGNQNIITTGSVGIGAASPSASLDIVNTATAGGLTTLELNPGAHTAMTAEKSDFSIAAHTDTITGGYASQRFSVFNTPTISAASALTVTNADTVNIAGIPTAAGSAVISGASALRIPAAPQSSANVGLVSLGSGAWDGSTSGYFGTGSSSNSSGTVLAVNAASAYAGDLANFEVAGASKFKVDASGNVTAAGTITATGIGDITSVGNVPSGAAFDGTQGTTLTFYNAGGNGILSYDGTDFDMNKPATIATSLTSPTLIGGTTTTSDLYLKTTTAVGAAGADMHFLVGNNGATEAMTILNSGNVGIGTTVPGQKLVVGDDIGGSGFINPEGRIAVGNTDGLSGYDMGEDSNNRGWMTWNNTDNYMYLGMRVGASINLYSLVLNNGNVGIGTTGPVSPLQVDPAAQATTTATFARTFVDNTNAITTHTGNTALYGLMIDEPNITVGTATPTNASSLYISGAPTEATNNYALWVDDGNVQLDGNLTVGGTITGTVSTAAPKDATYITQIANDTLTAEQALSTLDTGLMKVTTTTGVISSITDSAGIAGAISDETGSGSLVFGTTPTFTTSLTSPLVIGGTTTTSDLYLKTTTAVGAAGADMHFLVGDNGATEAMTILNAGNVGIGTTSPGTALQIAGSTGISIGEDKAGGTPNTAGALTLFSAGDNAFYTTFTAGTQTANAAYTLPVADGTTGQVLSTNGSGVLSWATAAGSGDITSVGNVTSGAAFDGTQGTTLTFYNVGGNGILSYDGTKFNLDKPAAIATSLTSPTVIGGTTATSDLNLKTTTAVGETGADMRFLVGDNGATEAMTILNSGYVGIGTTGPGAKLDVNGDLIVQGGDITGANSTSIDIGEIESNYFRVVGSGASKIGFRMENTTGAPELFAFETGHIETISDAAYDMYYFEDATSGENPEIRFYGYDTGAEAGKYGLLFIDSSGDFNIGAQSGEVIRFRTGGGDKVTINNTGNVGIGTTAPTSPLQVDSAAQATTTATFARTFVDNTNAITTNTGNTALYGLMIDEPNITVGTATPTNASSLYISGAPTEATNNYALWVDDGNVQLDGNLTVGGTITGTVSTAAPKDATYITQIANDTLTAEQALSTLDTGLMKVTTTTGVISSITDSAGIAGAISDETGSGSLVFGTTPTFTTSLTSPLVIGGTTTTSDLYLKTTTAVGAAGADMHFLVGDNGATEAMTILNSGNVGIGTTAPGDELEVNGDVKIDETAYFDAEFDNGNSGAADTIDWGVGNKQKSTLTGACVFTFTAPPGPCNLLLKLIQDGTGSRTVTWPAAVKWPGGTTPTLTAAAAAVDIVTLYYDGTNYYGQAGLDFK